MASSTFFSYGPAQETSAVLVGFMTLRTFHHAKVGLVLGGALVWIAEVAGVTAATTAAVSSAPVFNFVAKNGEKINLQIRRWFDAGFATVTKAAPFQERLGAFLSHANEVATRATAAGTVAVGRVGDVANATIYRVGGEFLVIEGSSIMSYVARAKPDEGIVLVYKALGGQ